jgi:hypothetical protein
MLICPDGKTNNIASVTRFAASDSLLDAACELDLMFSDAEL